MEYKGSPATAGRRAIPQRVRDVLEARHVSEFTIWLRFRDGRSGEVDLTHAMNGPVFEPLHDVEFFRQFRVHPEWKTLVWPNGADMAPEFLYAHVRVAA